VLACFERGEGTIALDNQQWQVGAGDAVLIAPGEIVRMTEHGHNHSLEGWGIFFPPDVIASGMLGGSLGWGAHPLLFPFVGRAAGGGHRLRYRQTSERRGLSTSRRSSESCVGRVTAPARRHSRT
jgi:AraC family transcriptional regulator, transcriptional activator of pobA